MTNWMNLLSVQRQSRSEDHGHISGLFCRDVSQRFPAQSEDAGKKVETLEKSIKTCYGDYISETTSIWQAEL